MDPSGGVYCWRSGGSLAPFFQVRILEGAGFSLFRPNRGERERTDEGPLPTARGKTINHSLQPRWPHDSPQPLRELLLATISALRSERHVAEADAIALRARAALPMPDRRNYSLCPLKLPLLSPA